MSMEREEFLERTKKIYEYIIKTMKIERRDPQEDMIVSISDTIFKSTAASQIPTRVGLFEAPTGTGKTYAYLIPLIAALEQNLIKGALIATNSNLLATQIAEKDIPTLIKFLNIPPSKIITLTLKGRGNYICSSNLEDTSVITSMVQIERATTERPVGDIHDIIETIKREVDTLGNPIETDIGTFKVLNKSALSRHLTNRALAQAACTQENCNVCPALKCVGKTSAGWYRHMINEELQKKDYNPEESALLIVTNHHFIFNGQPLRFILPHNIASNLQKFAFIFDEGHHIPKIIDNYERQILNTRDVTTLLYKAGDAIRNIGLYSKEISLMIKHFQKINASENEELKIAMDKFLKEITRLTRTQISNFNEQEFRQEALARAEIFYSLAALNSIISSTIGKTLEKADDITFSGTLDSDTQTAKKIEEMLDTIQNVWNTWGTCLPDGKITEMRRLDGSLTNYALIDRTFSSSMARCVEALLSTLSIEVTDKMDDEKFLKVRGGLKSLVQPIYLQPLGKSEEEKVINVISPNILIFLQNIIQRLGTERFEQLGNTDNLDQINADMRNVVIFQSSVLCRVFEALEQGSDKTFKDRVGIRTIRNSAATMKTYLPHNKNTINALEKALLTLAKARNAFILIDHMWKRNLFKKDNNKRNSVITITNSIDGSIDIKEVTVLNPLHIINAGNHKLLSSIKKSRKADSSSPPAPPIPVIVTSATLSSPLTVINRSNNQYDVTPKDYRTQRIWMSSPINPNNITYTKVYPTTFNYRENVKYIGVTDKDTWEIIKDCKGFFDKETIGKIAKRTSKILEEVIPEIPGGSLILCTNIHLSWKIAKELNEIWHGEIPIYVQGSASRFKLINKMKQGDENPRVLIGTNFWEGIDLPGEALRAVFITKLPFPDLSSPAEIIRKKLYENANLRYFDEYALPQMILTLKQGAGRLIRNQDDYGVIVLMDYRLSALAHSEIAKNSKVKRRYMKLVSHNIVPELHLDMTASEKLRDIIVNHFQERRNSIENNQIIRLNTGEDTYLDDLVTRI